MNAATDILTLLAPEISSQLEAAKPELKDCELIIICIPATTPKDKTAKVSMVANIPNSRLKAVLKRLLDITREGPRYSIPVEQTKGCM